VDYGGDGPITLRFESTLLSANATNQAQAEQLVLAYVRAKLDKTATTRELVAYLEARGIPERTTQRALAALTEGRQLVRFKTGFYRLPDPQQAAPPPPYRDGDGGGAPATTAPAAPSSGSAPPSAPAPRFALAAEDPGGRFAMFDTPSAPVAASVELEDLDAA
jgi:hypothetical protein